jgi:hypothetical protein
MSPLDPSIQQLLAVLDEAFDHTSWHGPNLRASIRGVKPELAARRPAPARHNIHEIVVHAAYWKYAVRRMLTGEPRGSFGEKGSNWFPRDEAGADQWQRDVELLISEHARLREAVLNFDPLRLTDPTPKRRYTYAATIRGAAAHDLYHAGQIQLIKRLLNA